MNTAVSVLLNVKQQFRRDGMSAVPFAAAKPQRLSLITRHAAADARPTRSAVVPGTLQRILYVATVGCIYILMMQPVVVSDVPSGVF